MSKPRIAHIFEYKWWRIQEGLTHREVPPGWGMATQIAAPEGAFVYMGGNWYVSIREPGRGSTCTALTTTVVEKVPKEIRTLALLLT